MDKILSSTIFPWNMTCIPLLKNSCSTICFRMKASQACVCWLPCVNPKREGPSREAWVLVNPLRRHNCRCSWELKMAGHKTGIIIWMCRKFLILLLNYKQANNSAVKVLTFSTVKHTIISIAWFRVVPLTRSARWKTSYRSWTRAITQAITLTSV